MELVPFLRMAEEIGDAPLHTHTFVERLGAPLVAELRACGLLVEVERHARYHCGGGTCEGRRVVDDPAGTGALLALCGHPRSECTALRLARSDTHAFSISQRAIEAALVDLFHVSAKAADPALPFVTLGEHRRPRGKMRDVVVVWRGGDRALTRVLDQREWWGPRTLVLVPTLAELPRAVLMRYRTVRRVEIAVLSEILSLEGGRLVLHAPARLPPARLKSGKERKVRQAPPPIVPVATRIPSGLRWKDIAFYWIDDDTLLLRAPGFEMRITCFNVGMYNRTTYKPDQYWEMLVRTCELRGWFTGKGEDKNDNSRISRFRDALQAAFGIEEDPFFRYARRQGWRARFGAHPERPKGPAGARHGTTR